MIIDRYNDYEERLYSTGYDELDELLERAFCDGYEYAQKEFNSESQKTLRKVWENELAEKMGKSIKEVRKHNRKGKLGTGFGFSTSPAVNSEAEPLTTKDIHKLINAKASKMGGRSNFPTEGTRRTKKSKLGQEVYDHGDARFIYDGGVKYSPDIEYRTRKDTYLSKLK